MLYMHSASNGLVGDSTFVHLLPKAKWLINAHTGPLLFPLISDLQSLLVVASVDVINYYASLAEAVVLTARLKSCTHQRCC